MADAPRKAGLLLFASPSLGGFGSPEGVGCEGACGGIPAVDAGGDWWAGGRSGVVATLVRAGFSS